MKKPAFQPHRPEYTGKPVGWRAGAVGAGSPEVRRFLT